jgi:hypothetical protein
MQVSQLSWREQAGEPGADGFAPGVLPLFGTRPAPASGPFPPAYLDGEQAA